MTTPTIEAAPAAVPTLDRGCGGAVKPTMDDVVFALSALPLRERVEALQRAAQELFADVNAPVVDWGDDADLTRDAVTVDDELAALRAERAALVEVTTSVVSLGRSLEASTRVLADQHARVVSRFDTLDADQLERRLSSPATALAGEFACDDYAPLLGVSPAAAARWADLGAALRSRHPRLLAQAGQGVVRVRACEVIVSELAHLEPEHVEFIEAEFLTGTAVHGSEANIRKQLRRLLDHHGLARPVDDADADSRIGLGFNEIPEQPSLTELFVTMRADDAWLLHAAIEDRAHALVEEWAAARPRGDQGYPLRRARVDALIDLALGNVRFVPDVRITVPVNVTPPNIAPSSVLPVQSTSLLRETRLATGSVWSVMPPTVLPQTNSAMGTPAVDGAALGAATSATGRAAFGACGTARPSAGATSVADVDVPNVGRVSGTAIEALGSTLGAHVTVALADAASGVTAWSSATTYRPGLAMRRHVEARDVHCRFPGCMRPAPMCDVDHVTPHAEGGATSPANLQLLCRHHHRAKTHGAWAVTMTPDGTCAWQSPVGHWLRTHPGDATAHRITAAEGMTIAARARAATTRHAA